MKAARQAEHGGREGGEDELAVEAEEIKNAAAFGRIESSHRHPPLVGHEALLGFGGPDRAGTAGLGARYGLRQHRFESLHAPAAQLVSLPRVDEVVQEIGQLHDMTVGVENGPWGLLGFTEIQVVNVAKS